MSAANELRILDPDRIRLRADRFQRLHLTIEPDEQYGPVRAVRCLPLTRPTQQISIQDDEGVEIGIIADLDALSPDSRAAVDAELELVYLKAEVTGIRRVEAKNGLITWDLDTSRGPRTIHVRDRQHIRSLGDGRVVLTDIHDGKYVVPRPETLDPRSRAWLEIEL